MAKLSTKREKCNYFCAKDKSPLPLPPNHSLPFFCKLSLKKIAQHHPNYNDSPNRKVIRREQSPWPKSIREIEQVGKKEASKFLAFRFYQYF